MTVIIQSIFGSVYKIRYRYKVSANVLGKLSRLVKTSILARKSVA